MFKLKRLQITGFKSFADHTDLIFTGDGITGVVGPNGCGKSNVADAIAWVLGEQRVKHLRGAEMKDVIFQGSRNRSPGGMAEVVLHLVRDEVIETEPDIEDIDSTLEQIDEQSAAFDGVETALASPDAITESEANVPESEAVAAVSESQVESTDPVATALAADTTPDAKPKTPHHRHWRQRRSLALEFAPGESVSVTRRLYRSGESEYLLNDRPCRLRDIQDLFSGTGLAGGHYAIIEQGRIGQILSAKPIDRRTIIEEAAGITKFRVRQRAAEARLDSARGNLSRISDIISEIERQVNSLRRQAAKERRYRVMREELRELLRHVYVAEDRSLASLLEETQVLLDKATEDERRLAAELAEREESSRAATHNARALEDELSQLRAAVADAALQRDRRLRERVYQEAQIESLGSRRAEIEKEIEALSARIVVVDSELERLRAIDAQLTTENDQTVSVLREAEDAHAQKLAIIADGENKIDSARTELLRHTAAAERLNELARQLDNSLEKLAQQAEGLSREGERAAAAHAERNAEAVKLNEQITVAREKLARLMAERQAAVKAVVEGHERVSDSDADLTRVRDDHSRALHRLESFKELDDRRAHYSLAVQEAFSANEREDFHLIGTLADSIQVDARWERAVEGVFGSSLQSILVATPDDAIRAAAWLKNNHAGRANFLVTGLHGGSDEVDVLTGVFAGATFEARREYAPVGIDGPRIADILSASRELLLVLERTMAERMNARIVDTLDDATALSLATGDMFVTTDGDWVEGGQFVNAGNGRALEEGAGLLTFKRELRELESRISNLSAEFAVAEVALGDARSRLTGLEESVVLLNASIAREEREVMAREMTAETLQHDIERAHRHMRVVSDDAERLEQERRELEESRARTMAEAETAESMRRAAHERIEQTTNVLATIRRDAEVETGLLNHQREQAAAAAERRRSTSADLRRLEIEREDVDARLSRYRVELTEAAGKINELTDSIAEIDRLAATVDEDKAREDELIAATTSSLERARAEADALANELAELNRSAASSRDARAAIEVQRAEAMARVDFVHENCANELNQSLEDLAREG